MKLGEGLYLGLEVLPLDDAVGQVPLLRLATAELVPQQVDLLVRRRPAKRCIPVHHPSQA